MDTMDGFLVIPVGGQVAPNAFDRLGRKILEQVQATAPEGLILNLSSIGILDSLDFLILEKIVKSVSLMGTPTVIVGIRPGVASSLVDMDIDPREMIFASTTEDAFKILRT